MSWTDVLPAALVFGLASLGLVGFVAAFRTRPLATTALRRIRYRHHRFQVALSALVTGIALLAHSAVAHLRLPPDDPGLVTFFLAGTAATLSGLGLLNRVVWEPTPVDPDVGSPGSGEGIAAGLAAGQALALTVGAVLGGTSVAFLLFRLRTDPGAVWTNPLPVAATLVSALLVVGGLLRSSQEEEEEEAGGPDARTSPGSPLIPRWFTSTGRYQNLAIQVFDPKGGSFVHQGPNVRTFWGVPAHRFEADPAAWLERVHPEDRPRVEEAARTLKGVGADATYRVRHPERGERWVRDRVHRASPGGTRWMRVVEDVTRDPRRGRERDPRTRDEEGSRLLEALPVHVATVDGAGIVRSVNLPPGEAQEVVGTPVDAYLEGDQRARFHEALEAAGEGEEAVVEVTVEDGEEPVRLECTVRPHPEGGGALVVAVDVTGRWRAQRLLEEEVAGLVEELDRLEGWVEGEG